MIVISPDTHEYVETKNYETINDLGWKPVQTVIDLNTYESETLWERKL